MKFLDQLRSIIIYFPVPLFAESLRVRKALISAILTNRSVFPCLTGCIKDLERLWDIDDFELLGGFEGSQTKVVTSLRHGNTFQLANKAILDESRLTSRKSSKAMNRAHAGLRETIVNISFVTPGPRNRIDRMVPGILFCLTLLQIGIEGTAAVALGLNAMPVGAALACCICITTSTMLLLRWKVNPIFGNRHAILSDQSLTVNNGAALDVHVIADDWNSSRLDVLCGYSSQIHSLTNIPARLDSPRILRWSCRLLALVFILQAALLASLTNSTDNDRWSGSLWLLMYLFMATVDRIVQYMYPKTLLEDQPATVVHLEPIHFSGRLGALLFIAMLPISEKAHKWAWWDVFMPDNDRRRSLQKEFEAFVDAQQGAEKQGSRVQVTDSTQGCFPTSNPALLEALSATKNIDFSERLQAFKQISQEFKRRTRDVDVAEDRSRSGGLKGGK
ncbi:hypothetical protein BDZ45DRAFT_698726 [Acephala macrosclerotiorum]|nr:hypothetical protein BDZ45DRAFT_698726 [Acephala macrosclerotiorum]